MNGYGKQKAALTRAKNSGDPLKVMAACRDFSEWAEAEGWPDDWHRWSIAFRDALAELNDSMRSLLF